MSAERRLKKPHQSKVKLAHYWAPDVRVVSVDGAIITAKADPIGTVFQINFTRVDFTTLSETFLTVPVEMPSPAVGLQSVAMQQVGPSEYEMPARKVIEASILVRPDHALLIAVTLLQNLNKMPAETKAKYQIPEMQEMPIPQPGGTP